MKNLVDTLSGILREQFKPENIKKVAGHQSGNTAYADLLDVPSENDPIWNEIKEELEFRLDKKVKTFDATEGRILSHAKDGINLWIVL